jgi:hypothetical protein
MMDFTQASHVMLWAAILLAFFALLRKSEFTVPTAAQLDRTRHLLRRDLNFSVNTLGETTAMSVFIKFSKTEQFGAEYAIPIAANGGPLCPVGAMIGWMAVRDHQPDDPLFGMPQAPLTADQFRRALQKLVRATPGAANTRLLPHSLRIGGLLALQEAGASELVVQLLGRWRSDAYKEYLRFSQPTFPTVVARHDPQRLPQRRPTHPMPLLMGPDQRMQSR